MENLASDPNLWAWIQSLAEGNVVIRVAISILFAVFFVAALGFGINQVGKHVFGRELVLPSMTKYIAHLLIRGMPKAGNRVRTYFARINQPRKPMTKRRRIVSTILLSVYFILVIGFMWLFYASNVQLNAYSTESGGVLVEVQARREPTDGFQFTIQFDRPARVAGIWSDVPTYEQESHRFNIRFGELVGFKEQREDTQDTFIANYPIATPKRSVFVYFQPLDLDSKQLQVVTIKQKSS